MQRGVLVVSHGTVDDLGDLPAFVANIRGGHASAEVVAELRRRYAAIGGHSPLNAISALLARKLQAKLGVPVSWASRLWKPYVSEVLAALARDGPKRVALVPLAQYSAHVYADDARLAARGTGLDLVCASNWGRNPKLHDAFAERIVSALETPPWPPSQARGGSEFNESQWTETPPPRLARRGTGGGVQTGARPALESGGVSPQSTVVMTAHSLPTAVVARGDPYEDEVRSAAGAIAAIVRKRIGRNVRYIVAFQSQGIGSEGRDGKAIEWLGPDLRTALDEVAASGAGRVVLAPIGFLADHVEILYDLDIEGRALAQERNLQFARAASLNADEDLVDVLADVARPLLGDD